MIDDDLNELTSDFADEQPMFEHHRFVVDKGQTLLRVDKYLVNFLSDISRNRIQDAAQAQAILVNETPVKSNYRVKPDDVISIQMAHPPTEFEIFPQNIPLNVVYEDDELLVINKQPGLVVHPGIGNLDGTLLHALAWHFKDETRYNFKNRPRWGLVHRIDKDTSGLLLIAKNEDAKAKLSQQFADKTTHRRYVALVWGNVKNDAGTIEGDIARDQIERMMFRVYAKEEGNPAAKHAVTHYKVLERLGYVSLVECSLETGRTHQIRVHMEHIGHPLFNDRRYGGHEILRGTTYAKYKTFVQNCFDLCPRQALHAKELGFVHSVTGEQMFFNSEIPQDMQSLIDKWRKYINNRDIT